MARLRALQVPTGNGQTVDERATMARVRVWAQRPATSHVQVRAGLISHRGSKPSFLRGVSTPKGAGVQVLLLALFEAQLSVPEVDCTNFRSPLHTRVGRACCRSTAFDHQRDRAAVRLAHSATSASGRWKKPYQWQRPSSPASTASRSGDP